MPYILDIDLKNLSLGKARELKPYTTKKGETYVPTHIFFDRKEKFEGYFFPCKFRVVKKGEWYHTVYATVDLKHQGIFNEIRRDIAKKLIPTYSDDLNLPLKKPEELIEMSSYKPITYETSDGGTCYSCDVSQSAHVFKECKTAKNIPASELERKEVVGLVFIDFRRIERSPEAIRIRTLISKVLVMKVSDIENGPTDEQLRTMDTDQYMEGLLL